MRAVSCTYCQRLPEEESSLYSRIIGQLKHYFDAFWIICRWLCRETFRLPLLLLFKSLELHIKNSQHVWSWITPSRLYGSVHLFVQTFKKLIQKVISAAVKVKWKLLLYWHAWFQWLTGVFFYSTGDIKHDVTSVTGSLIWPRKLIATQHEEATNYKMWKTVTFAFNPAVQGDLILLLQS